MSGDVVAVAEAAFCVGMVVGCLLMLAARWVDKKLAVSKTDKEN